MVRRRLDVLIRLSLSSRVILLLISSVVDIDSRRMIRSDRESRMIFLSTLSVRSSLDEVEEREEEEVEKRDSLGKEEEEEEE
jgi:hypothetical protein